MGLLVMILGLVLFLGVHVFTTQRESRARAIASMGEGGYKIVYALVSAVGLALIVWGFAHYRATEWYPDLDAAEGAETSQRALDAAGGDPGGRVLYPRHASMSR